VKHLEVFIKLLILTSIATVLLAGFFIRIYKINPTVNNNVVAYYYDRTNRLIENGSLPPYDRWGFAPLAHPENIPPFLAFFTFFAYKIANFLSGTSLNVQSFILSFPVLLYIIWALLIFIVLKSFSNRTSSTLVSFLILTFAPISIYITSSGRYTEESLGLLLFFLCFWLFLKRNSGLIYYLFLIASLTALVLAWQQFHIFFATMAIAIIVDMVLKASGISKRGVLKDLSLFVIPLILGHFISCYFFKISYSPIQMLKEFWIGIKDFNSGYLISAMRRRDWAPLSFSAALNGTGLFFASLILMGILRSLFEWRIAKYRYVLLFNVAAFFVAFRFSKNLAMLLPFGIYSATIGWESVSDGWSPPLVYWLTSAQNWIGKHWSLFVNLIKKKMKLVITFFLIGFLASGTILLILFSFRKSAELPALQIEFTEKPTLNKDNYKTKAKIVIRNKGGDSLDIPNAIAGIHIELENAEALNIFGRQRDNLVAPKFKSDYRRGNIFWFEVTFNPLKRGEEAIVEFDIQRTGNGEITIFYRGWLPGECPIELQKEAVKDLVGRFSNLLVGGWRHENCIIRNPANTDGAYPYCLVEVFAAHKNPQYYRCQTLKI